MAVVVNIPSENKPRRGPPITPKMVREAWRTPPKNWARKAIARHTKPYTRAIIFVLILAFFSDKGFFVIILYKGYKLILISW